MTKTPIISNDELREIDIPGPYASWGWPGIQESALTFELQPSAGFHSGHVANDGCKIGLT